MYSFRIVPNFALRNALAVFSIALLSACAGPQVRAPETAEQQAKVEKENTPPQTQMSLGDAVSSPLQDLNIKRDPIPPLLQAAAKSPYQMPGDSSCPALGTEIKALDSLLGPDVDAGMKKDEGWLPSADSNTAFMAVRTVIENATPLRPLLRKVSGAEQHERDLAHAQASGVVRRAFLKGLSLARSCQGAATAAKSGEQTPAAANPTQADSKLKT